MKKTASNPLKLSWKEVGLIAQGLSLASRPLRGVTKQITTEYGLGPRGAWILRLIETGQVVHPLDVTNFFHISRSVITEEVSRLTERGLIAYRQSDDDRRRVELALTPLGKKVGQRVREALTQLILQQFSSYSRDEVLQFCNMLQTFVFSQAAQVVVYAEPSHDPRPNRRGAVAQASKPRRSRRTS
jgi:DNA-binding MarR family transcriptional regulator